jgi:hypothetical protein
LRRANAGEAATIASSVRTSSRAIGDDDIGGRLLLRFALDLLVLRHAGHRLIPAGWHAAPAAGGAV